MPFAPDSPDSIPIAPPTQQVLDKLHITMICINIDPSDASVTSADVDWWEGYDEGATFVKVRKHSLKCEGAAFLTKMAEATNNGESFYDAVKRGFWEYLQSQGKVPAGTIA